MLSHLNVIFTFKQHEILSFSKETRAVFFLLKSCIFPQKLAHTSQNIFFSCFSFLWVTVRHIES